MEMGYFANSDGYPLELVEVAYYNADERREGIALTYRHCTTLFRVTGRRSRVFGELNNARPDSKHDFYRASSAGAAKAWRRPESNPRKVSSWRFAGTFRPTPAQ
jgi:hypothetical protein